MKKISTERNAISFLNINSFRKMKLILLFIGFCFFQLLRNKRLCTKYENKLGITHVKLSEATK